MCLTGYLVAINPNYPTPNLLLWFMYLISFICLFFGFVYFRLKPAKWVELDDKQKLQYGYFATTMNEVQRKEWLELVAKLNK